MSKTKGRRKSKKGRTPNVPQPAPVEGSGPRLRLRIRELEEAIMPFAELDLPATSGGRDVWLYVGHYDELSDYTDADGLLHRCNEPDFTVQDMITARAAVGLA